MYKIVMYAQTAHQDMFTGLTSDEAERICDDYGWVVAPDGPGSFEWSLEIEEDD